MLQIQNIERIRRANIGSYGNNESGLYSYFGDRRNFFESDNGVGLFRLAMCGDKVFRYSTAPQNPDCKDEYNLYESLFKSLLRLCTQSATLLYKHQSILDIYADASETLALAKLQGNNVLDYGPGNLHIFLLLCLRKAQLSTISYTAIEASPVHYCLQNLIANYIADYDDGSVSINEYIHNPWCIKINATDSFTSKILFNHAAAWQLSEESVFDTIILSEILSELPEFDLRKLLTIVGTCYEKGSSIIIANGLLKSLFIEELMYGVGGGSGIDILSFLQSQGLSHGKLSITNTGCRLVLSKELESLDPKSGGDLLREVESLIRREHPDAYWIDINFHTIYSPGNEIDDVGEFLQKRRLLEDERVLLLLRGEAGPTFMNSITARDLALKAVARYSEIHTLLLLEFV